MNTSRKARALVALAVVAGLGIGTAWAGGFFTNGVPPAGGTQYPSTIPLTGNETIPADTNLASGANPQSEAITPLQLAGYAGSLVSNINALIGGDATTNLWQRATTGSSVTTTLTYGGPDRWAYWSGTNTAMTVSRDSTAADLPTSYKFAFKMARTNAQTGVVQVCMAQEVETVNAIRLAGKTVELAFHAAPGATYLTAGDTMQAAIIYGTGTDEGLVNMAFGFNAGGGGGAGWTGQANAANATVPITSGTGRYAVVANIPATATEVGVALCFTPIGTAGASDYLAFSGIQLAVNPGAAALASATVGYSCSPTPPAVGPNCVAFERRQQGVETLLQQRYYYQLTESATIYPVAPCSAVDTTHTNCLVQFPVPMRAAPSITLANGFASPTSTTQATLGACTTLTAATTVAFAGAGTLNALVNCAATTIPAAGVASFLYSNNGSGAIKLSAEL